MPTRINGDNVRVPGYVYLENPLIAAARALATGPSGEIISTAVSLANLELLQTASVDAEPDTPVIRTATGGGKFFEVEASGNLTVTGESTLNGTYVLGLTSDLHLSMLSIQMGIPENEGVGLTIKARDGQTVNFFQWTDTSGTPIGWVHPDGTLFTSYLCLPLIADPGAMAVCGASDGQVLYSSEAIRIRSGKLQMKNLDDNLFYDVVLRAGPVVSVEGAGEP